MVCSITGKLSICLLCPFSDHVLSSGTSSSDTTFFSPAVSLSRGRGVHVSLQPIFHRPVSSFISSGSDTFGDDIDDLLCLLAIELVRSYSYSLTWSSLLCTSQVSLLFIFLQAHVVFDFAFNSSHLLRQTFIGEYLPSRRATNRRATYTLKHPGYWCIRVWKVAPSWRRGQADA